MRAGFARVAITPGPDLDLLGYAYRQERFPPGNAGVRDPLYVRVLALDSGDGPALIVSLDHCIVSVPLARRLRARAAAAVAIDPERVLLGCTHTHSGPWFDDSECDDAIRAALTVEPDPSTRAAARAHADQVQRAVATAAAQAVGLLVPVALRYRQAPCGVGYRRRVAVGEDMAHCWNPEEDGHLQPDAAGDPTLALVSLEQIGGPRRWLLWNLGVHPVVLGKTSRVISADYPGEVDHLLSDWLPRSAALFLLGAAGDVHPWISTQGDGEGVAIVGRAIAAQIAILADSGGAPVADPALRIATRTCRIGAAECDLAVWHLGPVRLVASPTELFGDLGAALRQRLVGPALVVTNCNGWTGYWPDAAAWDHPRYEVEGAAPWQRQRGDGERLVDHLVDLAMGPAR